VVVVVVVRLLLLRLWLLLLLEDGARTGWLRGSWVVMAGGLNTGGGIGKKNRQQWLRASLGGRVS
jgi:hypothetical protein